MARNSPENVERLRKLRKKFRLGEFATGRKRRRKARRNRITGLGVGVRTLF